MADIYINIPGTGSPQWKAPVPNAASLPSSGNNIGDVRIALSTDTIYVWTGISWLAVATPGAAIAIDGLIGDVLATGPGTVPATVAFVGGISASNIALGVNAANNATSTNTPNRIVIRDASGNFSAGTITANLTGNASGTASNITATSNSTLTSLPSLVLPTSQLSGTISLTSQVSGILPIANGGTGSATQNFMDLTTNQTAAGNKTFTGQTAVTNTSTTAFTVNTTSLVVDATDNAIGIGQTPQVASVITTLNTSGAAKPIWSFSYGTGSTTGLRGDMARGTVGSPTATQTGDTLNFISGRGYGTSQFATASTGIMQIVAGENFTNTSNATYLAFKTTPTGSVTSAERMRINSTGNILMGTTTDNGTDLLQIGSGLISTYIKLAGSISGYVDLTVPSTITTYTLNLPSAQATAGQFLFNDGAGNLSWSNPLSNLDGGSSNTIYVSAQIISGGTA